MIKELDLFSGEKVVDIVVGSKYWGTDYSGSDEERFQVFIPTLESVFLGSKGRSESFNSDEGGYCCRFHSKAPRKPCEG